jgi:hypothetical protein
MQNKEKGFAHIITYCTYKEGQLLTRRNCTSRFCVYLQQVVKICQPWEIKIIRLGTTECAITTSERTVKEKKNNNNSFLTECAIVITMEAESEVLTMNTVLPNGHSMFLWWFLYGHFRYNHAVRLLSAFRPSLHGMTDFHRI